MHGHANALSEGSRDTPTDVLAVPPRISLFELRLLGIEEFAYARRMPGMGLFAIHAADGTQIAVADEIAAATEHLAERGLVLLPVH